MKETVNALVAEVGKALKGIHDGTLMLGKDIIELDAENTRLRFEVERLEKALAEKQPEAVVPPAPIKRRSIKSFKLETLLLELERRGYTVHFMA